MGSRLIPRAVSDVGCSPGIFTLLDVTKSCFAETLGAAARSHALEYQMATSAEPIRSFHPFLSVIMAIAVLPYELRRTPM